MGTDRNGEEAEVEPGGRGWGLKVGARHDPARRQRQGSKVRLLQSFNYTTTASRPPATSSQPSQRLLEIQPTRTPDMSATWTLPAKRAIQSVRATRLTKPSSKLFANPSPPQSSRRSFHCIDDGLGGAKRPTTPTGLRARLPPPRRAPLRQQHHHRPHHPRRPYSQKPTSPNPTPNLGSPPPEHQTLSARLKKLSREYGWSALGVYLALSALDFPFCFLAVRFVGTERIGHAEHAVVSAFWRAVEWVVPDRIDKGKAVGEELEDGQVGEGWGVQEAQVANVGEDASLWTQLALAYAIHKSFIFVRVPLTAAILPKVVKTLRGWGWNIGKRTSQAIKGSKN